MSCMRAEVVEKEISLKSTLPSDVVYHKEHPYELDNIYNPLFNQDDLDEFIGDSIKMFPNSSRNLEVQTSLLEYEDHK